LTVEDLKERNARRDFNYSDKELASYFKRHNALELLKSVSEEDLKSIRWYVDCGDDDFLFEGNSLVHIAMTKKKNPHEYRVRDGGHSWTYWREALPTVLGFVSDTFHRN
jgi:S-formylglutathione hydrolase FrmB